MSSFKVASDCLVEFPLALWLATLLLKSVQRSLCWNNAPLHLDYCVASVPAGHILTRQNRALLFGVARFHPRHTVPGRVVYFNLKKTYSCSGREEKKKARTHTHTLAALPS